MIHSLFFLCSPIDTKTLRYDSLSCSPRRVWRNQVSTSAMKCHTPRPTQRLAMACHINLAETGRSVVLAAVSGKTRRATCASPTTRQRSPSWKGTMSACRQWHTKCDGRHASESEASTQSNTHTHSQKKNINQKWKNMRISEKPLPGSWWWTKDRHLPESFACRQWGLDGPKQEKIPTLRLLLRIQHQNLRNPPTTLSEGWPQHSTLDNPRNIMHKQVALALLQNVTIHCKNKNKQMDPCWILQKIVVDWATLPQRSASCCAARWPGTSKPLRHTTWLDQNICWIWRFLNWIRHG